MSHLFDNMTEPELKKLFHDLCVVIKYHLPKNTGFIILAAEFGEGGIAQYASNVRKEDAEKWMLETLARWHAGDFVPRGDDR